MRKSLSVLFVATILTSTFGGLFTALPAQAANSDPASELLYRQIWTLKECDDKSLINEGHDIKGGNPSTDPYGFFELFDNDAGNKQRITVGFDRDASDGVMNCDTIVQQGLSALHTLYPPGPQGALGGVNFKQNPVTDLDNTSYGSYQEWFVHKLTGYTLAGQNGKAIPHNDIEKNRETFAAQLQQALNQIAQPPSNDLLQQRFLFDKGGGVNIVNTCYTLAGQSTGALGSNDFALPNGEGFAYLKPRDQIATIWHGWIHGSTDGLAANDPLFNTKHAFIQNIPLAWDYSATGDLGITFTAASDDFYPIGGDIAQVSGGHYTADYAQNSSIVNCTFVKNNKDIIFAGTTVDAQGNLLDKNGNPVASSTPGTGSSTAAECQVPGGLGWVICPVVNLLDSGIKATEKDVFSLLHTDPGSLSASQPVWTAFRNLADAFFILIFIVILFANSLSLQIDSYTIKRALPKLVAAVVLVQLSFFIVQIGVDISNVFGVGIQSIFTSIQGAPATSTNGVVNVGEIFGTLIVGGAVILAAPGIIITVLILLLSAFISLLGVFFTLEVRQIVIQILLITSPIAFAAWVLPNTEKLFKMWYQNLIKVLLMFPMITLLVAIGNMLSALPASGGNDTVTLLSKALIPIVVFLMIPATFKASGAMMGAVSGAVLNRSRGLSKGVRQSEFAKNNRTDVKRQAAIRMLDPKSGRLMKAAGTVMSGNLLSVGKSGKYKKGLTYSRALEDTGKLVEEGLKRRGIATNNRELKKFIDDKGTSTAEKLAAMRLLGENGGVEELGQIYEAMYKKYGTTDTSEWRGAESEADRELWNRGTEKSRSELAKTLPHAVRPDGEDSLTKMNAEQFVSMKGYAGDVLPDGKSHIEHSVTQARELSLSSDTEEAAKGTERLQRSFQTMVNIGQSTDRRGRVDRKNVAAWRRAALSGDFGDVKMNVAGVDLTASEFASQFIKEDGEMLAVAELSRKSQPTVPPTTSPPPPPPPPTP